MSFGNVKNMEVVTPRCLSNRFSKTPRKILLKTPLKSFPLFWCLYDSAQQSAQTSLT